MPRSALTRCFCCILQDSGRFPRTFSLPSNASQRPYQRLLLHFARFWALSRTFLVASGNDVRQSPPSKCLAAPLPEAFATFCRILGAFQELVSWLQKATLGSSRPSNASQRPCQRLLVHFAGFWALSKNFSSGCRKRR